MWVWSGLVWSLSSSELTFYSRCGVQDAKNIEDIDVSKMKKLVVIDSTWQKAKTILRDERCEAHTQHDRTQHATPQHATPQHATPHHNVVYTT